MYPRTYSSEWDFKNVNTKEYTHGYHNYPAMMIPQIARKLLNEYRPEGHFGLLFDPYMGSGTSLVEASVQGIDSIGTDINPLACLIAEVKTTRYDANRLKEFLQFLTERLKNVRSPIAGRILLRPYHKSRLLVQCGKPRQTAVPDRPDRRARRPLVRKLFPSGLVGSNPRILLHTQRRVQTLPDSALENQQVRRRSFQAVHSQSTAQSGRAFGLQHRRASRPDGRIELQYDRRHSATDIQGAQGRYSVIRHPPPYGDSKTTVAYGQFSRWTNEWFQFENAQKIDSLLMGGQLKTEFSFRTETIARELEQIKEVDRRRYVEVMTFLDDYHRSIAHVSSVVRSGQGLLCRRKPYRQGIQIPLDLYGRDVRAERLPARHTYVRSITGKRMPSVTSPSNKKGANMNTMHSEYIVILKKE